MHCHTLSVGSVYRIGRGVGPTGNDRKIHDGEEMQPTNKEKYKLAQNVDGRSILSIQGTDGETVETLKMKRMQSTQSFEDYI